MTAQVMETIYIDGMEHHMASERIFNGSAPRGSLALPIWICRYISK